MRVAQIMSGRRMNGAVRCCLDISERLADRGHEVLLIHRPQLAFPPLDHPRVRSVACALSHDLAGLNEVDAVVRGARIEVMHTHMSDAHAYGVIERLRRGVPCVATAHTRRVQPHWAFNDRVICPSARTAGFQRRWNRVNPRRIEVIPNFIDADLVAPASAARRREVRDKLGVPQDALLVGSLGEITGYKRPSQLAAAVGRLVQAGVDAHLLLVGADAGDGEIGRVRRAIADHQIADRVRLLGFRRDARDLLAAFDVYAMASRREEMPIAVLEAMASGLPIVGADVGGMPDLVSDGDNGWLVRPGDVAALGRRLADLAKDLDLRARFGARSREMALDRFAPDPILTRIEAVLQAATLSRAVR